METPCEKRGPCVKDVRERFCLRALYRVLVAEMGTCINAFVTKAPAQYCRNYRYHCDLPIAGLIVAGNMKQVGVPVGGVTCPCIMKCAQ